MEKKMKNVPEAWVVSAKDRGRKSIKNGKVFLKDGEEFEIELYNPLQLSVLADIELNGVSISKKGLIIKPGQRIYLDCFIDDLRKFIFKTYEVENTSDSLKSIDKNGLLQVFFYKEDVVELEWREKFKTYYVPYYIPKYVYIPYSHPFIYGNTTNGYYNSTFNGYNNNLCSNVNNITYSNVSKSNIETGRVERGDKSKQEFDEIYANFQKSYISSTLIKILPDSRKPVTFKDIKKHKNKINLIKELYDLYDSGILKIDEYEEAKSRILSKF